MSWDIYGNTLRPGFCEVHPDIAQPYPCFMCQHDAVESQVLDAERDAYAAYYEECDRQRLRDEAESLQESSWV